MPMGASLNMQYVFFSLLILVLSLCRAEYSYSAAASLATARNKHSKIVSLQKEPGEPPRQFGRNAYV